MSPPRSKVEVGTKEARYYDILLSLISLGIYPRFIRGAIDRMDIQPGQSILDLGSGTGRNDCLMGHKIGSRGRILGLDISNEMLSIANRRCRTHANIQFSQQRIEVPLGYREEFDKVFISVVLHGFEDAQKSDIISNAYQALKPGGIFYILDYNEFDLGRLWLPLRWAFTYGECQLASEFLKLDLKAMLYGQGFSSFEEDIFFKGHLRLLKALRPQAGTTLESQYGRD